MTTRTGGRSWDGIRRHDLHRLYVADGGSTSDAQIEDLDIINGGSLQIGSVAITEIKTTLSGTNDTSLATTKAITDLFGGAGPAVVGPGSATDNAIARFDGTSGTLIQDSNASIDDTGNLTSNNFTTASRILVGTAASKAFSGNRQVVITGEATDIQTAVATPDLIVIGNLIGPNLPFGSQNIIIGNNICPTMNPSSFFRNVILGTDILQGNSTSDNVIDNVLIGDQVLANATEDNVSRNVMIGRNAGTSITAADVTDNVVLGSDAADGVTDLLRSVVIGSSTIGNAASGNIQDIVAIGYQAGLNLNAANDVVIGYQAGLAMTTGTNSVIIGKSACTALTSGSGCVAVGESTSIPSLVDNAVVVGKEATTTGAGGVSVGYNTTCAAAGVSIGTGASDTSAGIVVGANSTGSNGHSILIGVGSTASHADSIIIGDGVSSTASGEIRIGGASQTSLYMSPVSGTDGVLDASSGVITVWERAYGGFIIDAGVNPAEPANQGIMRGADASPVSVPTSNMTVNTQNAATMSISQVLNESGYAKYVCTSSHGRSVGDVISVNDSVHEYIQVIQTINTSTIFTTYTTFISDPGSGGVIHLASTLTTDVAGTYHAFLDYAVKASASGSDNLVNIRMGRVLPDGTYSTLAQSDLTVITNDWATLSTNAIMTLAAGEHVFGYYIIQDATNMTLTQYRLNMVRIG